MDGRRFDLLTQTIGRRISRRGAFGLLAGIGAAASLDDVSAKPKKHKKPCAVCKTRKHGKCKPAPDGTACGTCKVCQGGACGDAPDGADCGGGQVCTGGTCACPNGQTLCGDACADLATDANHCGACGRQCASGDCVHGGCTCITGNDCPSVCTCSEVILNSVFDVGGACQAAASLTACRWNDDCPVGSGCIIDNPVSPSSGGHCGVPCV